MPVLWPTLTMVVGSALLDSWQASRDGRDEISVVFGLGLYGNIRL
jgi:hypothetical protein